MIDEDVVMVDNSRASRDLNFDLSKVRVCASACVQSNIYREDNKVQKATSLCLCFSFFLLVHLPPSLWQQAWSHLSNPTTNTHRHSAGTYTVSELQRHPAVGVGVHFQKLQFPSDYKCNWRSEKCYNPCKLNKKDVYI